MTVAALLVVLRRRRAVKQLHHSLPLSLFFSLLHPISLPTPPTDRPRAHTDTAAAVGYRRLPDQDQARFSRVRRHARSPACRYTLFLLRLIRVRSAQCKINPPPPTAYCRRLPDADWLFLSARPVRCHQCSRLLYTLQKILHRDAFICDRTKAKVNSDGLYVVCNSETKLSAINSKLKTSVFCCTTEDAA